jgi:hypothetical protein
MTHFRTWAHQAFSLHTVWHTVKCLLIKSCCKKCQKMEPWSNWNLPCKIWGSHSGVNSSMFWGITPCSPLKVNRRFGGTHRLHLHGWRVRQARNHQEASLLPWLTIFRRNPSPPSSGLKNKPRKQTCRLNHDGFLLGLLFSPEDRSDIFLRNVGWFSKVYTALYRRRQNSWDLPSLETSSGPVNIGIILTYKCVSASDEIEKH